MVFAERPLLICRLQFNKGRSRATVVGLIPLRKQEDGPVRTGVTSNLNYPILVWRVISVVASISVPSVLRMCDKAKRNIFFRPIDSNPFGGNNRFLNAKVVFV